MIGRSAKWRTKCLHGFQWYEQFSIDSIGLDIIFIDFNGFYRHFVRHFAERPVMRLSKFQLQSRGIVIYGVTTFWYLKKMFLHLDVLARNMWIFAIFDVHEPTFRRVSQMSALNHFDEILEESDGISESC